MVTRLGLLEALQLVLDEYPMWVNKDSEVGWLMRVLDERLVRVGNRLGLLEAVQRVLDENPRLVNQESFMDVFMGVLDDPSVPVRGLEVPGVLR